MAGLCWRALAAPFYLVGWLPLGTEKLSGSPFRAAGPTIDLYRCRSSYKSSEQPQKYCNILQTGIKINKDGRPNCFLLFLFGPIDGQFSEVTFATKAIMGPSGAGKTTFMNVLCGKAGDQHFDGENMEKKG